MPGLIGKKIGMTSLFDDNGKNLPCTVIEAGPCVVTQLKTTDTDGYEAIQLAYGEKREKVAASAQVGHFKKAGTTPKYRIVEIENLAEEVKVGDQVGVDIFQEGEFVDISGVSKGKGFQGVVKRHGFSGAGESTHGQQSQKRASGSIGAGSDPSRVFKGMKMGGRTGGRKAMVENLRIIKVDAEKNLLVVKGSVPGSKNSYVTITK
ncbi:MAG: 50S ribosomal protein L3 [Owenweeksia sp.]|nr:50S ribosomal protein L3 [Owenweeksia sp.]